MEENTESADALAAVSLERATIAVDVAETFTAAFEDVDSAEKVLESIIARSNQSDLEFWREVFVALAQIRG